MTVPADKPKKIAPKKIAIVVHQEHSRPGRVGALLEKRGYELHRLCPNLGCNLPDDMSDYAGVVIFGGPMSANDCGTLAGIKCELEWIPKVVEAGVPFLGLCLGQHSRLLFGFFRLSQRNLLHHLFGGRQQCVRLVCHETLHSSADRGGTSYRSEGVSHRRA